MKQFSAFQKDCRKRFPNIQEDIPTNEEFQYDAKKVTWKKLPELPNSCTTIFEIYCLSSSNSIEEEKPSEEMFQFVKDYLGTKKKVICEYSEFQQCGFASFTFSVISKYEKEVVISFLLSKNLLLSKPIYLSPWIIVKFPGSEQNCEYNHGLGSEIFIVERNKWNNISQTIKKLKDNKIYDDYDIDGTSGGHGCLIQLEMYQLFDSCQVIDINPKKGDLRLAKKLHSNIFLEMLEDWLNEKFI